MMHCCGNCYFWFVDEHERKAHGTDDQIGWCRRFPPRFTEKKLGDLFPATPSDMWCGEWQTNAKEGAPRGEGY